MEIQEFIQNANALRGDMLRQARHYLDSPDDAEDAVQETLVRLWMARDRIADAVRMRNMAGIVCRNVSLNMLRDTRTSMPLDRAVGIAASANPQTAIEEQEYRKRLRQGIDALSDKQRAIIRMRNVEGMTYADIARIIGTTESSVRGMISKARLALIKKMKGELI